MEPWRNRRLEFVSLVLLIRCLNALLIVKWNVPWWVSALWPWPRPFGSIAIMRLLSPLLLFPWLPSLVCSESESSLIMVLSVIWLQLRMFSVSFWSLLRSKLIVISVIYGICRGHFGLGRVSVTCLVALHLFFLFPFLFLLFCFDFLFFVFFPIHVLLIKVIIWNQLPLRRLLIERYVRYSRLRSRPRSWPWLGSGSPLRPQIRLVLVNLGLLIQWP